MRGIIICYVSLLFMCLFAGVIVALVCCCSLWWALLFLFLLSWVWVPLAHLRDEVSKHADFSTLLFVLSFAVWCVVAMSITMRFNVESFVSVMCVVSVWSALLMTIKLISLIRYNHLKKWIFLIKKVGIVLMPIFL